MAQADQTVTYWIQQLKTNDPRAARELFDRYFRRLIALARGKLGDIPQRLVDPEDVAASAFKSLCLGAAKGRFPLLEDREDLWRLMVTVTHQKTVDHIRRRNAGKRGGGLVRGDSAFINAGKDQPKNFDEVVGDMPEPEFLVMLQDQFQYLLAKLKTEQLRQIALAKLEGKATAEIAAELKISLHSVERKLGLIREEWQNEFSN